VEYTSRPILWRILTRQNNCIQSTGNPRALPEVEVIGSMKTKILFRYFLVGGVTFIAAGCGFFDIHPKNTVKNEANYLETIPIGTSYETVTGNVSGVGFQFTKLDRVSKLDYFSCLIMTPNIATLYRQWPKGILLNINDDDMCCRGIVCDTSANDVADFVVFFDRNHRFKGYYAFSHSIFSKDDKKRYKEENQQFHELGFDEISALAPRWARLAAKSDAKEDRLPNMPLSNWIQTNLTSNKFQVR